MRLVSAAADALGTGRAARRSWGDLRWFAFGAAALLVFLFLIVHLQRGENTTAQLASKASRVDLLARMQLDLASASEAEKSAVLAVTDEDAKTFAEQARAASARVEQERRTLGQLLTGSADSETALFAQVSAAFVEFQKVDEDLLALTARNTNVKAYALAFGPAATALAEMNAALDRLVEANAESPEARRMMPLAYGAEVSALRIQTLLPPHIAEESNEKMDELEATMAHEDAQVKDDLDGLAAIPRLAKDPDLVLATARYAAFGVTRGKILALSRENTNVRSLSISLHRKRQVMRVCQAALGALKEAILEEPIAGVTYGAPVRPR